MRRGRTVGVLQARTTSTRLPGKVLRDLSGRPMIVRQLERMARARTLDEIVVATSQDSSDDELTAIVEDAGFRVVRGPLDDVLARFIHVIEEVRPMNVVRLTADCPLICPSVIDLVVARFDEQDVDYASNTMTPTYPDGEDVEVATAQALRDVAALSDDPHEHEHVTLGIYRRPDRFTIANVTDPTGADNSHLRWTVDTPDDFAFVQQVYELLNPSNPTFEYTDILGLLDQNPGLHRTASDAPRNAALDGLDTGVMRHRTGGGTS